MKVKKLKEFSNFIKNSLLCYCAICRTVLTNKNYVWGDNAKLYCNKCYKKGI